jgi:VCBS repeat-containing protein
VKQQVSVRSFQRRWLRISAAALLAVGCAVVAGQARGHAQSAPANALKFFKNYFVTGDYAVGGVGLRGQGVDGIATGNISIEGVPAGADIVAAYLYWQVVSTSTLGPDSGSLPVVFKGHALSSDEGPFGKVLDAAGAPPCRCLLGANRLTYTYRADVLRFFDIDTTAGLNFGKYAVNGQHEVKLPDSGHPLIALPMALGASLVVIYRTEDTTTPLSAIVLYDGGYTLNVAHPTMEQAIEGFYQAGATANAKLTHIVGGGQWFRIESLWIDDMKIPGSPFKGSDGDSWDTKTFSFTLPPDSNKVVTRVGPSLDCLTWGAVIFKTEVRDSDQDGLLDVWEDSTSPILDPDGQPLPNLNAMGASSQKKDLFMELGSMKTDGDTAYGGVVKPAHTHLPAPPAIKLMGDAFKNAPVVNPDGSTGITLHVDAGSSYPSGADEYMIRGAGLARGGEAISEASTVCSRSATDPPWICQFSDYPGTVGWKTGFQFLRDGLLTSPPLNADGSDPCDAPGNDGPGQPCERRFDRNRKDIFHYALFAHFVGLPKSELPCRDSAGTPVAENPVTGLCSANGDPALENPDFHVPRTNTGIGDFRGGDILMTLGAFSDIFGAELGTTGEWTPFPVGTTMNVAGTLMHEFGHNAWRRHGGEEREPNCKPTYLSVMNYLYQLRGLLTDNGESTLDFARQVEPAIDETTLADGVFPLPYRIGWYAPIAGSYLEGRGTAARRHCDGSNFSAAEPAMVRLDARTAANPLYPIDWLGNGTPDAGVTLDVNFDGQPEQVLVGSEDWSKLGLNQIGSRRNVGGLFTLPNGSLYMGPMSLAVGRGDTGRGDTGRGDTGRGDTGRGDTGRGDTGRGDTGRGDTGRGDTGRGDTGRGDTGRGDDGGGDLFSNVSDPSKSGGELDFETATDLAKTPPNEFAACVIGVDCTTGSPTTPLHSVSLGLAPPNVGNVSAFIAYRVPGAALVPGAAWTEVGRVASVPDQATRYALIDGSPLTNGAQYTYFAVAAYPDDANPGQFIQSDPSNVVTITAVNLPFAVGGDSYATAEDTPLNVSAPGVLANDGDPDSVPTSTAAVLVSSASHGTLTVNANGSFTYAPSANYNGSDSFSYKVLATYAGGAAVETAPASVTLSVTSVNDPPVAADDTYTLATASGLSIAAPGVLSNDTDLDSPALTAVLVTGPSGGGLVLNPDGSFAYTRNQSATGADSFTYQAVDGSGARSNVSTVRINSPYVLYGLLNVPPAATCKTKAGSTVPLKWQFRDRSSAVNSSAVHHVITVVGSTVTAQYRDTDSGSSSFRYDSSTKTWTFNLQTKGANGVPYPVGTYTVTITPTTPGYLGSGPFPLTLTK